MGYSYSADHVAGCSPANGNCWLLATYESDRMLKELGASRFGGYTQLAFLVVIRQEDQNDQSDTTQESKEAEPF